MDLDSLFIVNIIEDVIKCTILEISACLEGSALDAPPTTLHAHPADVYANTTVSNCGHLSVH